MKYIRYLLLIFFLSIASTFLYAEQKIVVLDMKFVLNNSKAGKEAQTFLKKKFNDNAKKFTDIEKSLRKDEEDLLSKKTVLSKEDYKKQGDLLRNKVIDYQSKRKSTLEQLAKQRADARAKLIKTLEPIVDTYINKNSISIVIDKKFMIGGLNEFDITKAIVENLNKELPSLNLK